MPVLTIPTDDRDYYLQPGNLPDKPKAEIADYVESQGFLVPERFESPTEADTKTPEYIVRSEHPYEYFGPSNIFDSHDVGEESADRLTDIDNRSWQTFQFNNCFTSITVTSAAYGFDLSKFLAQCTFSTWKIMPGINRFMFADPSIQGRYFVGSTFWGSKNLRTKQKNVGQSVWLHSIVDGEFVETLFKYPRSADWLEQYGSPKELVRYYESIRNLDRFNPEHCPIIEFQSDSSGQHWFLQYHRGRDLFPVSFTNPRFHDPNDGIEFKMAIGATSEDGEILDVAIGYEDGESLSDYTRIHKAEVLARCNVPVLVTDTNVSHFFEQGIKQHGPRSLWTKPPLTIFNEAANGEHKGFANVPASLTKNVEVREVTPGLEIAFSKLHVVSDGISAIVNPI